MSPFFSMCMTVWEGEGSWNSPVVSMLGLISCVTQHHGFNLSWSCLLWGIFLWG